MATVKAKSMTNETIGKYDESINCDEMAKMYSSKTLSRLAADEWVDYYRGDGLQPGRQVSPALSCFCTAEYERVGNDAADNTYTSKNGK